MRRWVKKKKKKRKKRGKKKKKKKKKQQQQQQKHTTQKTHRPYSSLDLTDPNFAFGRIFYNFARIKNQPFWFWAKSSDLVWISVNITWKSQYCLLFTTMGDDYICLGIPVNIRGVDQYPQHAVHSAIGFPSYELFRKKSLWVLSITTSLFWKSKPEPRLIHLEFMRR